MTEQEAFAERRKYKRVDLRMKVEYKKRDFAPHAIEAKRPAEKRAAESANISLGGMQIIDDVPQPCGQILSLAFRPAGPDRIVRAFAKVQWADFDEQIKKYRIGLEFYYMPEEYREIISSMVN